MHVTISLVDPPSRVRGWLRNAFLEPQSNLFVGALAGKQLLRVLGQLEESRCVGVVIVHTNKVPGGVKIKCLGEQRKRSVVDFDGVQIVKRL